MGTDPMQPLTLICNYPDAKLYTFCEALRAESEENRSKGVAPAEEICRRYRLEGRFFDEILKAGK